MLKFFWARLQRHGRFFQNLLKDGGSLPAFLGQGSDLRAYNTAVREDRHGEALKIIGNTVWPAVKQRLRLRSAIEGHRPARAYAQA